MADAGVGSGLCGTGVEVGVVETSMREALGKSALKLESHETELAGVGKGFVSNVVRLRSLVWTGDDGLAPTELILKVPTTQKVSKLFDEIITEESEEATKSVVSEGGMQILIPIIHNKVHCHLHYLPPLNASTFQECQVYDLFAKAPPSFCVPKVYKTRTISESAAG